MMPRNRKKNKAQQAVKAQARALLTQDPKDIDQEIAQPLIKKLTSFDFDLASKLMDHMVTDDGETEQERLDNDLLQSVRDYVGGVTTNLSDITMELSSGANIHTKDGLGHSALSMALASAKAELVTLLQNHDSNEGARGAAAAVIIDDDPTIADVIASGNLRALEDMAKAGELVINIKTAEGREYLDLAAAAPYNASAIKKLLIQESIRHATVQQKAHDNAMATIVAQWLVAALKECENDNAQVKDAKVIIAMHAIRESRLDVLKYMIDKEIFNINAQSVWKIAGSEGSIDALKMMMQSSKVDLNIPYDSPIINAMTAAQQYKQFETIRFLSGVMVFHKVPSSDDLESIEVTEYMSLLDVLKEEAFNAEVLDSTFESTHLIGDAASDGEAA